MTYLPLPDEAQEALAEGKTVKLTSADFGKPGHNGTLTIDPEPYADEYVLEPDVEVVEDD